MSMRRVGRIGRVWPKTLQTHSKPVGWVERSASGAKPIIAGSCENDGFRDATLCSTHPTTAIQVPLFVTIQPVLIALNNFVF